MSTPVLPNELSGFDQPVESNSQDNPRPVKKKKSAASKHWNSFLKLVRRVHLYSGIFMFPFVLLYGFTGWFFNHPRYFTGDEFTYVSILESESENNPTLIDPDTMARQVVEEMQLESFIVNGPQEIELTDDRSPQLTGYLTYTVNAEGGTHQISIHPVTGKGEVYTTYSQNADADTDASEPRNPLAAITGVQIRDNVLQQAQELIPSALESNGLEAGTVNTGRRAPSLMFSANVDGAPAVVTYNLGNGSISALRVDAEDEFHLKSLLQRLHLARSYAPHMNAKWLWAVQVDLMFASMVFWGISGLLMWWQIKRTRSWGTVFLIASIISAAVLIIGMMDQFKYAGGRGGGRRASISNQMNYSSLASVATDNHEHKTLG
ncbi:hypothetical protein [Calycomorphotria hydatis]|uniref:PepSY-associated TM helix n=1 Tax=Calycomorphotria hydatis TaxID=2528027 RepID=A0A517TD73_9PLAN|nr:hypothetical protein [Calycomorphotria hydatis]QDT66319.1 hypothetical protein V22_35850 [Calycomorphotria hydatis]